MKKISISKRAIDTPASPIRKLYSYASEAKERGIKVYHLNIGQPDLPTPREFFNQVRKFSEPVVAYAPSQGYLEVITAWQEYYRRVGINFKQKEIIITTGASEAINFALAIVAEPGSEVIVFEPLYSNYVPIAQMVGIRLKPITLHINNNYHLPSKKEIEAKISSKTKAIIINNPSNPTGAVYTKRELQLIVSIAKRFNLFIIADETYREFIYTKNKFVSMMDFATIRQQVILIDSVSKKFSLCGARIGCLASKNRKVMEAALKFAQGRLSSPTLEQLAVVPLLKSHLKITRKNIKEYKKRREVVIKFIGEIMDTSSYVPEGAFYAFVTLPVKNVEHFCRWLLEKFSYLKETVLLAPGDGFYISGNKGKREVRIAYVLNSRELARAFNILKKAFIKYNQGFK